MIDKPIVQFVVGILLAFVLAFGIGGIIHLVTKEPEKPSCNDSKPTPLGVSCEIIIPAYRS